MGARCFLSCDWLTARKRHVIRRFVLWCLGVLMILWLLKIWYYWGRYEKWKPHPLPRRSTDAKYFIYGRDQEIFMYSAIANAPPPPIKDENVNSQSVNDEIRIVITTLDKSRVSYDCCVLFNDNKTLHISRASIYFRYYPTKTSLRKQYDEYFSPTLYIARQYTCTVPITDTSLLPSHVTLTTTQCSSDVRDYLPVLYPPRVPGGLALCAKIAHSGGLDPEKVIEWFEIQRILGVDKILMFDLGNPESLNRVLRYYQQLGILDLQPYELPGYPRNRSLKEDYKRLPQFSQDETMAVLECRQRMAGYDYVISHDVDEFIIPRRDISLKDFIKENLIKHPNAAGYFFYTEFFILTWGPTNPEEDLMVRRYRMTRVPRWECYKYVYLPSRVIASLTHEIFPMGSYEGVRLSPDDVILHHYRECPKDTWGTCTVSTTIDDVMVGRYPDLLDRVLKVRKATSTSPSWKVKLKSKL